jgi:hypothetical protein
MFQRILALILHHLHPLCTHPDSEIHADLTEGASSGPIEWCRICGSVKTAADSPHAYWRAPRSPFASRITGFHSAPYRQARTGEPS